MSKEQFPIDLSGKRITGVFVDLETNSAIISHHDEVLGMFKLAPEGLIFHAGTYDAADLHETRPMLPEPGVTEAARTDEREKPVTLQGRLKSKPKQGRPDRTGKPTAWARFAAHEEGQEQAHMYSTTFHRHTADMALGLEKGNQLTVQGYPHESDDPEGKRMDTLSVINLLDYPGKPEK